jgi:hypothetical protein
MLSRVQWGMANIASAQVSGEIRIVGTHPIERTNASLVPTTIIRNPKIGPGAKLVYSKLLSYARNNEIATTKRIAGDIAASPRSVRNYIAALKSAGLIRIHLQPGKPSSYTLITA